MVDAEPVERHVIVVADRCDGHGVPFDRAHGKDVRRTIGG